jgi:hypothetical protein
MPTVNDELDLLARDAVLLALLHHYAPADAADRLRWRDRCADLAGLGPRDLARLHGTLLTHDLVELNPGAVGGCYRLTVAGRRALRQVAEAADEAAFPVGQAPPDTCSVSGGA